MSQFHEICTFFFFFDNWQEGWTPLHCAGNIFDFTKTIQLKYHLILISWIFFTAQAGHLDVVKLLTESGAATTAETTNGKSYIFDFTSSSNVFLNLFFRSDTFMVCSCRK